MKNNTDIQNKVDITSVIKYLNEYSGPELRLMEVCGTHTAAIFKNGIRSLISPKIKLISGPGCPVCVTPTEYIDKCIAYGLKENHVLLTFGDMLKVPGTKGSLSDAKGQGAKIELMYSPFEVIEKARKNPNTVYVIAAVGFETTAPSYGLVLKEAIRENIKNIKVVTALKIVEPPLEWICQMSAEGDYKIDGFICPGHVSVITGSEIYDKMAERFKRPFVVAGFSGEHILAAIYHIVKQIETEKTKEIKRGRGYNLYKNAVKAEGNVKAQKIIEEVYKKDTATWRGMGEIQESGLYLKGQYAEFDGGSFGLDQDAQLPKDCCCKDVIIGKINPNQCSLFGNGCSPENPIGPCMVSAEGACGIWYRNVRVNV